MEMGSIEVICGPMFSGKTEELLRRAGKLEYAHRSVVLFKPEIDDRYRKESIVSHNRSEAPCAAIRSVTEMLSMVGDGTEYVIIDEFQFLGEEAVGAVLSLKRRGINVILSGLDLDFRGEPFMGMAEMLAYADKVTKLTAVCSICHRDATRTQRLVAGKPADYSDPLILVGASESYEARCASCHEVPNRRPFHDGR